MIFKSTYRSFGSNEQINISLLPLDKQKLIIKLRGIIISSSLKIIETQKSGRLTFVTDSGDVAFICVKQNTDYVEVGFFKGILLNDPEKLLEGKSKEVRRIRIRTDNEIPVLLIKRWVRQAVSLNLQK